MFLYILFILPSYLKIGPRIRVGAPTRVLDSARCSLLPWLGVAELSTHHCADGLADFRELSFRELVPPRGTTAVSFVAFASPRALCPIAEAVTVFEQMGCSPA